jgi:hypothetical protein
MRTDVARAVNVAQPGIDRAGLGVGQHPHQTNRGGRSNCGALPKKKPPGWGAGGFF